MTNPEEDYDEYWRDDVGIVVPEDRDYPSSWPVVVKIFEPETGEFIRDQFREHELTAIDPPDDLVARLLTLILEES